MDDERITELFWRRDPRALEEAQTRLGASLSALAGRILPSPSDAEECVNDVYLKLWQSIPPARPADLRLFALKICRNTAISRYRSLTAEKRGGSGVEAVLDELAECVPGGGDPADEVISRELSRCLGSFVRSLPRRQRLVFLRRYFYAESVVGIAGELGMSPNAVSALLLRCRKKLKKFLMQEGFEP